MPSFPKLESLGIRVGRAPRLLGGRAFVRQRDLTNLRFWQEVDQKKFAESYLATPGKSWIPYFEWADVLEKALSAEGALK